MILTELLNKLNARQNGAFIKLVYEKELPLLANAPAGTVVNSIQTMCIRKGIEYDKQKSVKEAVANGKVLTHELPWGTWKIANLIIEHKGKEYLRAYVTPNKTKTVYLLNGKQVSKDDLVGIVKAAALKETQPEAMALNIANIVKVCDPE